MQANTSAGGPEIPSRRCRRATSAVSDRGPLAAQEFVMQQRAPCSLDLVSTLIASLGNLFDHLERHEQRQGASLGGGHADAAAEDVSGCLGNNLKGVGCAIHHTELCKLGSEMMVLSHQPGVRLWSCLLYTSPSPRDRTRSRMPSSA